MWGIIVGILAVLGGLYVSHAVNGGIIGFVVAIGLGIYLAAKVK